MMGITKEGKWLPYEGPIEKISSGEWEQICIMIKQAVYQGTMFQPTM